MESKYIEDIFKDYLATDNTNYALLINGSWGSGKTYFWKTKLSQFSSDTDLKPIYLSLNGLSKIETLDYQLKIKLIPFLNKLDIKKSASIGNLSKNILTTIIESKWGLDSEKLLKNVDIDLALFSKTIICFDDLERCKIPLSEVLGYINNFVEHKNLKVVILSNEKEISKTKLEDEGYHTIKEKVIGRILNYKNNLNEILPILYSKYNEDASFKSFLDEKNDLIFKLLKNYKVENLRNLSFYLDNLKKLYPNIKDHKDYIDEILFFTLLISLEFKDGHLESNDYENFKQLDEINPLDSFFDFDLNFSNESETKTQEKILTYSEAFYKRYLDDNIEMYKFYKSIYTYVLSGYLNEDELKEELQSRYPLEISKEVKAFQIIATHNYQNLTNEEFDRLSKEVLEYSEQGKYRIYDYIQISNFYNHYIKNNLIDIDVEALNKILIKGINEAKKSKEINERLYNTMFHFSREKSDKTIIDEIEKAHNEILLQLEEINTNEFLEYIDTNNLEKIDEHFEKYSYSTKLFELISADSLFNSLITAENKTIVNFTISIVNRYSASNIGDFLHQDSVLLIKLNTNIREYVEQNSTTLKIYHLKELHKKIEDILLKITR